MNEFLMAAYEADKAWLQAKIIEVLKGAATMEEQPPHLKYSLNLYIVFALNSIKEDKNPELLAIVHDTLLKNLSEDKSSQSQMNKFLIAAYEADKAWLQAKIIKVLKGAAKMEEQPPHLKYSLNLYIVFALNSIKEDKNPELLAIVHDTLLKNLSEDKSSQSQMNEFLMAAYEADKAWLQAKIIEVLKGAAEMEEQPPHLKYSLNLYMAFALYLIKEDKNPELLAIVHDTLLKNLSEDKSSQTQMSEFLMAAYETDKAWLQAKIIEVLKGADTMTEQRPAHLEYSLNLYMAFALYFIKVERNPELLFAVVKDYPSQFNELISAQDCLQLVSIITIHSLYGINPNFVKYILTNFFASASSDYKHRFSCKSSGDIDKFIKNHHEKSLDLLPLLIDLVRIWIDQSVNDNDVLKVAGFIQRIMQILNR